MSEKKPWMDDTETTTVGDLRAGDVVPMMGHDGGLTTALVIGTTRISPRTTQLRLLVDGRETTYTDTPGQPTRRHRRWAASHR